MRICFFGDGSSVHTRRWTDFFVERNDDVHLVTWQPYTGSNSRVVVHSLPEWDVAGLILGRIPKARAVEWILRSRSRARRIVQMVAPDLIHGHSVDGYGHLAALSGFRPCVLTAWGMDVFAYRSQPLVNQVMTRWAIRSADLVTVNSEALRNAVLSFGNDAKRIQTVQFGVDTRLFRPGLDTTDLRRQLELDPGHAVIFSVRAVHPMYNIHTIVRAFNRVRSELPHTKLLLADYSPVHSYRDSIFRLIQELDLEGEVQWVGAVDPRKMPLFLNLSDVLVSMASSDTSPVSVHEAMACGTRVIASDLPGVREWIADGVNGFLAPPGDIDGLARKIVAALSLDSDTAAGWSIQNRMQVEQNADLDTNMTKMAKLYETLLAGASVSTGKNAR